MGVLAHVAKLALIVILNMTTTDVQKVGLIPYGKG
jgi:hypothetical protein